MSLDPKTILQGACDFHVHCSPDVVPRAQDCVDLAEAAHQAGMLAVGLKDHTTSTVGRCYVLNRRYPQGPRFLSSIVLNPPVGGLNPAAVEAALLSGVDIVYFPTYGAQHHIDCLGPDLSPVPKPKGGFTPVRVLDENGDLIPVAKIIVDEIAAHDAILATGHLAPAESIALLRYAAEKGVAKMIVTHASESVPNMSIADQKTCVGLGAFIEHSFLAVTPCCPGTIALDVMAHQIREVGIGHCILSSDFGQVPNGPPVPAYAEHLQKIADTGFTAEEIHQMISINPQHLL